MAPTTSDLVLAHAREYMAKDASFMSTIGGGLRRGASWTGQQIGRGFREGVVRPLVHMRQDRRLAQSAARLRQSRVDRIRAAGKGDLLGKLQKKLRAEAANPLSGPKPTPVAKPAMGLGKKLMIGGGLLAAGATMAGGAAAAKTRAQQPLAPPEMVPPGY